MKNVLGNTDKRMTKQRQNDIMQEDNQVPTCITQKDNQDPTEEDILEKNDQQLERREKVEPKDLEEAWDLEGIHVDTSKFVHTLKEGEDTNGEEKPNDQDWILVQRRRKLGNKKVE